MELDHLFLLVEPDAPEVGRLEALGLVENYRRDHLGQGTSNVCYIFDNAYLELLWLTDEAEARAPAIARTRLANRARWRENGSSPFGIALRSGESQAALPFPTLAYRPPYLPEGGSIPVAAFSDDPAQPFVFVSPGRTRPDQWTGERQSARQTALGMGEIANLEIILPQAIEPAAELQTLISDGLLKVSSGPAHGAILTLSHGAKPSLRLALPDCRLI